MADEKKRDVIIKVRGLTNQFGDNIVHDHVDLDVYRGEVLAIVGGSGSGKSVLLRSIIGLIEPAEGDIEIFGVDPRTLSGHALEQLQIRWGMLFQEGALFSALTVFDNIALPLRELRAFGEPMIRDLVMAKLAMVGIEPHHAVKMPSDLSGGMIKRIALARALALEPDLLFLDEPTAGLDPDRSESFVTLVKDLHRELNLTVVMVTHDLDTLVSLSQRVAVLCEQRLVIVGTLDEVVDNTHPFICNFFMGERGRRALEAVRGVMSMT